MLDTLTIARNLVDAGAEPKLADAMATALKDATEAGDHVTPERFEAGLAKLDARISDLDARLTWRFAGALLAQTAAMAAIMAGLLRLFSSTS